MQCTINVRSRMLAQQILAKSLNSPNIIARQNLLIYSIQSKGILNFKVEVTPLNSCIVSMPSVQKKATIHQVTTMLATSKNALFPGHNHLLTTGTDDPSLACARAMIKLSGHQYWG